MTTSLRRHAGLVSICAGRIFAGIWVRLLRGPLSARDGPVGVCLYNHIICMTPVCIILLLSDLGEQLNIIIS